MCRRCRQSCRQIRDSEANVGLLRAQQTQRQREDARAPRDRLCDNPLQVQGSSLPHPSCSGPASVRAARTAISRWMPENEYTRLERSSPSPLEEHLSNHFTKWIRPGGSWSCSALNRSFREAACMRQTISQTNSASGDIKRPISKIPGRVSPPWSLPL